MQHREHIILEFCDQVNIEMQEKLFRQTILSTINRIRDMLPDSCSWSTVTDKDGAGEPIPVVVLDTNLHLLVYEILQGLSTRYKTLVDKTVSENLDAIKAKEDLQGCKEWNKNFKDINWVCKQVLVNMINICACY